MTDTLEPYMIADGRRSRDNPRIGRRRGLPIKLHRHRLYKYFSDLKFADEFLEGKLLFRSLAYFRHYEDEDIRRDQKEGVAVYRPEGGLVVTNLTQGTRFTLPGYAFESSVKQEQIFIYCMSGLLSDKLRDKFGAVACVEIKDIRTFCSRIEAALPQATFPEVRGRMRIGSWVEYYDESEGGNPRWALPDKIATAKSRRYSWQSEFRLVYSLTDSLSFENVNTQLVKHQAAKFLPHTQHHSDTVKADHLRDICWLHEF